MNKPNANVRGQSGFSLVELMIALTIALVLMMIASTLFAASFKVRNRENQRSAATADAQRALNAMSREIANAGYGLSNNGIVAGGDSGSTSIRLRSDLDLSGSTNGAGEDVKYLFVNDANGSFIVRLNLQPSQTNSLLANRIDGLTIYYYDRRVTYTIGNCTIGNCNITNVRNAAGNVQAEVSPDSANYIVLSLIVTLPAVGVPGSQGYQPPSATQLVSSVTLRNASLSNY